jgi:hypothetical protein
MIGEFYLANQLVLLGFFVYAFFKEEFELTKDNLGVAAALIAGGPLGSFAIFCVVMHQHVSDRVRKKCGDAVHRWEVAARADSMRSRWDWYKNMEAQEERYNLLREHISILTDAELEMLSKVSKSTFEIEKPVRDAIFDEILHRNIMR